MDEPEAPTKHWRWWAHVGVLAAYPIVVGALGHAASTASIEPMLPAAVGPLLVTCAAELLIFGVIFASAWLASRAKPAELMLQWRGNAQPLLWGILYSMGLRVALMFMMLVLLACASLLGVSPGEMVPRTDHVVNAAALKNPVYFLLTLTVVSFVVAGLREELWRAGILAGLANLFPGWFGTWRGRLAGAGMTALVFGLGHATQGFGGVVMTAILGFGLGAIMLWHKSVWEAVLAHGFFNATTFAMLYVMTGWGAKPLA